MPVYFPFNKATHVSFEKYNCIKIRGYGFSEDTWHHFWQKLASFPRKPATTLTFLSKLPKLPVLIWDERFTFPRFPRSISVPSMSGARDFVAVLFMGWNFGFKDLGNCLWGLKPPHPLCSRASALQSTLASLLFYIVSSLWLIKSTLRRRSLQGLVGPAQSLRTRGIKPEETCSLMVWDSQTPSTSRLDNPSQPTNV